MEILNLIKNRRTIHSFTKAKVSDEILRSAIEAAIHAPNHHLTWPWFFIRVEGEAHEKIADLYARLKSEKKSLSEPGGEPMSDVAKAAVRAKILEPPVLLFAGIKKPVRAGQTKEDYAALACALQNMALFLWSQNIGMKWSTGAIIRSSETYSLLGISPDTHEIGGMISIGAAKIIPKKTERPAIDEFYWTIE